MFGTGTPESHAKREEEAPVADTSDRDDPATQDRGQPVALDVAVEKLRKLRDDRGTYNPFLADKTDKTDKAAA